MSRHFGPVSIAILTASIVFALGFPLLSAKHAPRAVATTVDVQDFDQLWFELVRLEKQARELDAEEIQRRVVTRTAEYLGYDDQDESTRFAGTVALAFARLHGARERLERANVASQSSTDARRDAWSRWLEEQRDASDVLLAAMDRSPRHDLLAEKRLRWLLRLDAMMRTGAGRG